MDSDTFSFDIGCLKTCQLRKDQVPDINVV